MNLMQRFIKSMIIRYLCAIFLTNAPTFAATLQIPPCPEGSEREYIPNSKRPLWASCRDEQGLYNGLLIQFSTQTEVIRIASMKGSLRDGREIRFGVTGTLEERTYKGGHLDGPSYLFKSEVPLGRVFPASATQQDWQKFTTPPKESMLKAWLKVEPFSTTEYSNGRLTRLQFDKKDYQFRASKEGRIFSVNHPEMKGLFFLDPEALWDLNAADTKAILKMGFGSCKKYDGPLGRYGRHYDVLLFKRELVERKHLDKLKEIRDRLIQFCVPEDLRSQLGVLECPPHLPSLFPQNFCLLSISDQLHIPYEPKYFTFEFTMGRSPEEIFELFKKTKVLEFMSKPDEMEKVIALSPQIALALKKTSRGLMYKLLEKDKSGRLKAKHAGADDSKDWWEWRHAPGF